MLKFKFTFKFNLSSTKKILILVLFTFISNSTHCLQYSWTLSTTRYIPCLESSRSPHIDLQTLSNSVRGNSVLELVPMAKYLIQNRNHLNHSGKLRIKTVTNFPQLFTIILDTWFYVITHIHNIKYFPFMPLFNHFFHKSVRQTVSRALQKSINAQNVLFDQCLV